ncbi:MAG: twin-arginine translocation signal domain-containing protein [Thermomicrobiaceae bacterium]|nr:twin-arginine translocation signal domain-containing protein [Thermomicrobiaceae bacterium]
MARLSRRQFVGGVGVGVAGLALGGAPFDAALSSLPGAAAAPAAAGPRTWRVKVGVASGNQAIQGMAFLPEQVWVNVGDTIQWRVTSGEFHTVTFLPPGQPRPPFDPADPMQALPQGGSHYDGKSYVNSGLLVLGQTYALTFDVAGDFVYLCLVHGMMLGVVHVRPAGTPYPFSQDDYDALAESGREALLDHGDRLIRRANAYVARANGGAPSESLVVAGIGDGVVAIMRFIPASVTIRAGQTVAFTSFDSETPHTVTFGEEPADPFPPSGDPTNYAGGSLNSGFIGLNPFWFGPTFRVRFTQPGTYPYICALHDELGMVGKVVVR